MVGRHHLLFGDTAFAMASYTFCATSQATNARMARKGYAANSSHSLLVDAGDPRSGLVNEFRKGVYGELLWFI